jgi:hypothetical protein
MLLLPLAVGPVVLHFAELWIFIHTC